MTICTCVGGARADDVTERFHQAGFAAEFADCLLADVGQIGGSAELQDQVVALRSAPGLGDARFVQLEGPIPILNKSKVLQVIAAAATLSHARK